MLCTKMHLHAYIRARGVLQTEPFTQRNLCTEPFLHKETLHKKTLTPKNLPPQTAKVFTHRNFDTQKLYPEQLLHRNFSAQKRLCTTVFTQTLLPTDAFTRNNFYTEACAHSTFLHTASFYTERLCFPFLITYLFRVPPLKLVKRKSYGFDKRC